MYITTIRLRGFSIEMEYSFASVCMIYESQNEAAHEMTTTWTEVLREADAKLKSNPEV